MYQNQNTVLLFDQLAKNFMKHYNNAALLTAVWKAKSKKPMRTETKSNKLNKQGVNLYDDKDWEGSQWEGVGEGVV